VNCSLSCVLFSYCAWVSIGWLVASTKSKSKNRGCVHKAGRSDVMKKRSVCLPRALACDFLMLFFEIHYPRDHGGYAIEGS
jgi:hypothetical protein